MSKKTRAWGFTLAKTSGFTPNWGFVKNEFVFEDSLTAEHQLKPGEIIWWVDGEAFTFKQAEEIAKDKAQDLFGHEPSWLDSVVNEMDNTMRAGRNLGIQ